jgi:ATP-dependent helicase/DNAse subunit B
MQTRITPFGRAGWDERKRLLEEIIRSRQQPPYLYNDVLILVSSARLKRRYGRLLLTALQDIHHAHCLVQPDILTLHQFIQQQYAHLGGPRLMDEQSRLVLLEGLVKEQLSGKRLFNQSPDLLAPSLSSVLSAAVEQLANAGVTPTILSRTIEAAEFSDKPQVKLLQQVYARYEQVLQEKNLTDPAGIRHHLRDQFDPSRLAQYRMVVLDGIHDAEQVELGILNRIAAGSDCILLVDAPSPALVNRAGQNHPLRTVREFLAGIGCSVEEDDQVRSDEPMSVAEALFSDEPFERTRDQILKGRPFSDSINLLSAINTREEVSLIARQVKESLGNGTAPDSILVTFPALDEYAPLVEELFDDYGIPYNRALGRQLATSAVATAVISLLRAGQDDFPGPALLRVFSSPFLKYGGSHETVPAVDRFLRKRNIIGGRQKLLAALGHAAGEEESVSAGAIEDLISALEPFGTDESAGLSVWMDRLSRLLDWSRLGDRVALIRGPLNINLQAYRKLSETFLSLAAAGRTFPEYRYTFSEWLFLLRKTLMHTRFQVPPEDEGGVQVLGLEESLALPWNEVFLGGLIDAKFPQRLPQNIFLPDQALEAMGVRTPARARLKASYHFYRLLLSAAKVTLSYPEQDGDRPVVPSPFLKELAPLEQAGILNKGVARASGLQFSLALKDSRSLAEMAKALAIADPGKSDELRVGLASLPEPRPEVVHALEALIQAGEARPRSPAEVPCPGIRDFRVTDLDVYLACPYDYYISRVLGIEPLAEVTEDLTPLDRGSKVHAILRDFYRTWTEPVARENRPNALRRLRELAVREFSREADTFRNRRTKELFLSVMVERFLDAEIEFWTQGMKPAYLEQVIDRYPLRLSNNEEVHLSGRIDRIDCDAAGNFVIVDYKTGKYPLPKRGSDQDIFQLPIYAVMAKDLLAGSETPLITPVGLAYYDLAGKTDGGARDVVLYDKEAGSDHPSSKPNTSPKTSAEFQAILQQSLDKARLAVEGILAGKFPAAPRDEGRCRFCASQVLCRKDEID